MRQKTIGVLVTIAASVMWAIEPVLAKLSYTNADFLHTSVIRALVVTGVAFLYVLFTNQGNIRTKPKEFAAAAYVALIGATLADLLYFFALTKVPVLNAVVIGHIQPLFIILIGHFLLWGEPLTKYDYFGVVCMILAGLMVTTATMGNLSALHFGTHWDAFMLLATIAWATTCIVARRFLSKLNAGVITFYRFGITALVLTLYVLGTSTFTLSNPYQLYVGIAVGVGTILYYEGLKRLKAAQSSALELCTPFFAAGFGLFMLGEHVTPMQLLALLTLGVGVYFLSKHEV